MIMFKMMKKVLALVVALVATLDKQLYKRALKGLDKVQKGFNLEAKVTLRNHQAEDVRYRKACDKLNADMQEFKSVVNPT